MAELKRSIVLAGIKHCGKSTLGALLARRYHAELTDTDRVLEECFQAENGRKLTTREIFLELGPEAFRRFEAAVTGGKSPRFSAPSKRGMRSRRTYTSPKTAYPSCSTTTLSCA